MTILVTGSAGFIGFHVARALLGRGVEVIGVDNHNDYYDTRLKQARVEQLLINSCYRHFRLDIAERDVVASLFREYKFEAVIHLAAQAGVRHSIDQPYSFVDSNLLGFASILEGCRHSGVAHLVYASSSSVYGANVADAYSEHEPADHPLSLYAATKRANELMAHCYSHLYQLPSTGLRFFTVYGPWGRPDMALFKFTRSILEGQPIKVFNNGHHARDFTYIDDIVGGILSVLNHPAGPNPGWCGQWPDPGTSGAPWRLYNIGNSQPIELLDFIRTLEDVLGRKAQLKFLPQQPGDVLRTSANIYDLKHNLDYRPQTQLRDGVEQFVCWFRDFYKL